MTRPALPKDLTAAMAQPLVLAILAREDDYGYGILQKVRALSGGALAWKEGMLYPVLRRLEKEGLVLRLAHGRQRPPPLLHPHRAGPRGARTRPGGLAARRPHARARLGGL